MTDGRSKAAILVGAALLVLVAIELRTLLAVFGVGLEASIAIVVGLSVLVALVAISHRPDRTTETTNAN